MKLPSRRAPELQNFGIVVFRTSISSRPQIWGTSREQILGLQDLRASGLRNFGASERKDPRIPEPRDSAKRVRFLEVSGLQNNGNSRVGILRFSLLWESKFYISAVFLDYLGNPALWVVSALPLLWEHRRCLLFLTTWVFGLIRHSAGTQKSGHSGTRNSGHS